MQLVINSSHIYNGQSIEQIINTLQSHNNVLELKLNLNQQSLSDEEYQNLFINISKFNQLTYLDLNLNNSNPKYGGLYYFDCIKKCQSLKKVSLSLSKTSIGDEEMSFILSGLKWMKHLTEFSLDLSKNTEIRKSLEELGEQLCKFTLLTKLELNLSDMLLTDFMLEVFLYGKVGKLKTLHLNVSNNKLDRESVDIINEFLLDNNKVQFLSLELANNTYNSIEDDLISISECMQDLPLTSLRVKGEGISKTPQNLYPYITDNKHLKSLQCSGFSFCWNEEENKGVNSKKSKEQNCQIESLHIDVDLTNQYLIYSKEKLFLFNQTLKTVGQFQNLKKLSFNFCVDDLCIKEIPIMLKNLKNLESLHMDFAIYNWHLNWIQMINNLMEYLDTRPQLISFLLKIPVTYITSETVIKLFKYLKILKSLRCLNVSLISYSINPFALYRYFPLRLVSSTVQI